MSARSHVDEFLAFLATLAAAREDATDAQLAELQRRLVPKMRTLLATHDATLTARCDAIVRRIMGPTWAPRGEWAAARANAHQIIDDGIRARGGDPEQLFAPR